MNLISLETVDSTNEEAKRRLRAAMAQNSGAEKELFETAITAGMQTAGKGRRGRNFHSPGAGDSLYISFILPPPTQYKSLQLLTVAAAVAVSLTIEEVLSDPDKTNQRPSIKWVNDVLVKNKKICGILAESVFWDNAGTQEQINSKATESNCYIFSGIENTVSNNTGTKEPIPDNDTGSNDVIVRDTETYTSLVTCTNERIAHEYPDDTIDNVASNSAGSQDLVLCGIVLGIGININMKEDDFPEELREIAGSLMLDEYGLECLTELLCRNMSGIYSDMESGKADGVLDLYRKFENTTGRRVRIIKHIGGGNFQGAGEAVAYAKAIADDGGLVVVHDDGSEEVLRSGEISIKDCEISPE